MTVVKIEAAEMSEFQRDLDANVDSDSTEKDYDFRNNVSTWDVDRLPEHTLYPRSFNLLETTCKSIETQQFDCYSGGTQLWTDELFEDDFGDRVRQIFRFERKMSMVVPNMSLNQTIYGGHLDEAMADSICFLNTELTYGNLIEHSSLIWPLSGTQLA